MRQDLSDMFTNGKYKMFSIDFRKRMGIFPNDLSYNATDGVLVLHSWRSAPDFSISQAGLDFCISEELRCRAQNGGVRQAYVALCEGRGDDQPRKINVITAEKLKKLLRGYEPLEGTHGKYWWVDDQFVPTGQSPVYNEIPW